MSSLLPIIKKAAGLAVFAFMAWGLWKLHDQLGEKLADADPLLLGAAVVIAALYLFLNASVWAVVLRTVGANASRRESALLWVGCEAMRWLPGGIWGYASRVVEGSQLGIDKGRSGLSLAIELVLTVASWMIVATVGFLFSPVLRGAVPEYLSALGLHRWPVAVAVILIGLVLAATGWVFFRARVIALVRGIRERLHTPVPCIRALGEYILLNHFYVLGFLACLAAVHTDPMPGFATAAGAYALAWIGGFVAFGAPGGMGVREGLLYLMFLPMGNAESVVIAAILWRAIQIVLEIFCLLIVKLTSPKVFKKSARTTSAPEEGA